MDTKNFKNGDRIQVCGDCGWQTETAGDKAIGRCPRCKTTVTTSIVEKAAPKKAAVKKAAPKKVKSED
jgi:tRNA(Ile2) C34 agmatinyltransferase TiaS